MSIYWSLIIGHWSAIEQRGWDQTASPALITGYITCQQWPGQKLELFPKTTHTHIHIHTFFQSWKCEQEATQCVDVLWAHSAKHLQDTVGKICLKHFCFSWNVHFLSWSENTQPYQRLRQSSNQTAWDFLEATQPEKTQPKDGVHQMPSSNLPSGQLKWWEFGPPSLGKTSEFGPRATDKHMWFTLFLIHKVQEFQPKTPVKLNWRTWICFSVLFLYLWQTFCMIPRQTNGLNLRSCWTGDLGWSHSQVKEKETGPR